MVLPFGKTTELPRHLDLKTLYLPVIFSKKSLMKWGIHFKVEEENFERVIKLYNPWEQYELHPLSFNFCPHGDYSVP